jgi:DinB superfamily
MQDYVIALETTVDRAVPSLLAIPEPESRRRPAPGKWSPSEIVGHLIDSASNNHRRFVVARWQEDLVFEGYRQDGWVEAQEYDRAPWSELVTFWAAFNRHLARVMAAVPADVRTREHRRHNLHEVAWRTVPASAPATLDYFMADYVAHLQHHLRQILGADWQP